MDTNNNLLFSAKKVFHRLPAGILPGDKSIELFAIRENRKVYFVYDGQIKPFKELPSMFVDQLIEKLISDPVALRDLKGLSNVQMLEEYAFCLYGTLDSDSDYSTSGKLKKAENFRCGSNCKCLKWASKKVEHNGKTITQLKLNILDALATGKSDKEIADQFFIEQTTLNTHKKQLFNLFKVASTKELLAEAIKAKILQ